MKKSEVAFTLARIVSDLIGIYLALILAYYLRMVWFDLSFFGHDIVLFSQPQTLYPFQRFLPFVWKFTLGTVLFMAIGGRYRFGTDEKILDEVKNCIWSVSSAMALLLVYFFFSKFPFFSRLILGLSWGFVLIFVLSGRMILRQIRSWFWRKGFGQKLVLILGAGNTAKNIIKLLNQNPSYTILGVLPEKTLTTKTFLGCSVLGNLTNYEEILKNKKLDEVIFATENSSKKLSANFIKLAHIHHITFRFIPDELGLDMAAIEISTLKGLPIMTFLNTKLLGWGLVVKSFFDYIFAILIFLLLSPILIAISFFVWISDTKAPIIYGSMRVGKKGKNFLCYKFRTMIDGADKKKSKLMVKNERKGGVLFKIKNDPRITIVGKFLRKYSLDELPQLWNILKGDMSFIGHRPHLPEEVAKYKAEDLQVLTIKPGLSGFSQVNGRSNLSFEEEMKYELFYMKNWSIWLDIIIFFKSIWIVFRGGNK